MMKTLHFSIIIGILYASCFVLSSAHAQDCMGGPFCGGNIQSTVENRNVTVSLNFYSNSTMPDNVHYLWLRFFDAKNDTLIKNVSFFINATKGDKVLMHELFYTKTGLMLMKFYPSHNTEKLIINGTSEPMLGGMMSENDTLPITTSVFAENGIYDIHLEVLAMNNIEELIDPSNPITFDSQWLVDEKGNISKYDNSTTISPRSSPHITIEDMSPLQQFKSGISASDVKCKPDFLLVIKSEDNHPACTTPLTALHLLEFGWGSIASPFETKVDLLDSKISGGQITGFHYDLHVKSIVIKIQTTSDGHLTVTIPRKLLDIKESNGQDSHFYVLRDSQEVDFTETSTTDVTRTLTIPFTQGTLSIDIIGALMP